MSFLNLNLTNVAPSTGTGEPVPSGWCDLRVVESSVDATKDNTGRRLNITIEVLMHPAGQQYVGRKIFHGFNIQNSSPKAVEIAMGELSALAHSVGVLDIQDTQQLHGIPFKGRVIVKLDDTGKYEPKNEIKSFQHISYVPSGVTGAPAQATPAAAAFAPAPAAAPAYAPAPAAVAAAPTYAQSPAQAPAPVYAPAATPAIVAPAGYQHVGFDLSGQAIFQPIIAAPAATQAAYAPPVAETAVAGGVPWAQ
jgi:hypothetical protein